MTHKKKDTTKLKPSYSKKKFNSVPSVSRTALGPTQPPIQGVLGALSLVVKGLGHEADHSPPSSAKVKE